jgi:hypothetical protein
MPDAEGLKRAGDQHAEKGRDLVRAATTERDDPAIIWDKAGVQYQHAAVDFEEAAAAYLAAEKKEAAEAAYTKAAEFWQTAAQCWKNERLPMSSAGWALENAASDYAALAAINERDAEFCEAVPARERAADAYHAAVLFYLDDAAASRKAAKDAHADMQKAIAVGDPAKADVAANTMRVNRAVERDDMRKAQIAAENAANEFARAAQDSARCK